MTTPRHGHGQAPWHLGTLGVVTLSLLAWKTLEDYSTRSLVRKSSSSYM